MVNKVAAGDESDLSRFVESLLRSRPDLADPNKLRQFEEMLNRKVATLNSAGGRVLPDVAPTDRAPARLTPEERFMCFVLHLVGSGLPAMFIVATFPRVPLPILPLIVLISFFATRYLYRAEHAERLRDKPGGFGA